MKTFKVGIIGLGVMGSNHFRVVNSLPSSQVVGIFDTETEKSNHFSPALVCKSIGDLIKREPNYCVIATPTSTHENIAMEMIQSKINFLIEKPVSLDYESALRIMKSSFGKSISAVGHVERHNSAVIEARRLLKENFLGKIFQVVTRRQGPKAREVIDIGVAKDLATHDIDVTRWILETEYDYCFTQASFVLDGAHEDMLLTVGKLKNGVTYNHIVNWCTPFKERKMIITGEKGVFEIDMLSAELVFHENGFNQVNYRELSLFKGVSLGNVTNLAFDKNEPLVTEHLNFQKLICGEISDSSSIYNGAINLLVAESFIESSRDTSIIRLKYDT